MIDHAQAKINLINAAIKAAESIKFNLKMSEYERIVLDNLKGAVAEYNETRKPKPSDYLDDDSFHGTG